MINIVFKVYYFNSVESDDFLIKFDNILTFEMDTDSQSFMTKSIDPDYLINFISSIII